MPVKKETTVKEKKTIGGPATSASQVRPRRANKPAAVDARDPSSVSPLVVKTKSAKILGLSVPVYTLAGVVSGSLDLPKDIFGSVVNKALLSQALRVYLNNQKSHNANTKTRGEVMGSTAKIWRQKGTGRARHGARKAPIFVGGGVAFGPKYRNVELELPKKMKQRALIAALSQKLSETAVFGVSGVEKATGKTKEMATFVSKIDSKNLLIVAGDKQEKAQRAVKNIQKVNIVLADQLSVLDVISHNSLFLTQDAVSKLESKFKGQKDV